MNKSQLSLKLNLYFKTYLLCKIEKRVGLTKMRAGVGGKPGGFMNSFENQY